MKVVILSGGKGTRLKPYTEVIPKSLLPLNGKPVLEIILERLKNQGIDEVILAVNYGAYLFKTLFGEVANNGMKIQYSSETSPLGTAGPLKLLEGQITENFFLMNGDLITDLEINRVKEFHEKMGADITVVTREIEIPIEYGVILAKEGKIAEWEEKPKIKLKISTGMYLINPEMIDLIPQNEIYNMPDLVLEVIKRGGNVLEFLHDGEWIDMGTIEDYKKAQEHLGVEEK
jgi:mannose-1-phosphate guanylyltransferase